MTVMTISLRAWMDGLDIYLHCNNSQSSFFRFVVFAAVVGAFPQNQLL